MKFIIWPRYMLKGAIGKRYLSPIEGRMMLALLAHREVSRPLFAEVIWPDVADQPDYWYDALGVHISNLRHALRSFRLGTTESHGLRVVSRGA